MQAPTYKFVPFQSLQTKALLTGHLNHIDALKLLVGLGVVTRTVTFQSVNFELSGNLPLIDFNIGCETCSFLFDIDRALLKRYFATGVLTKQGEFYELHVSLREVLNFHLNRIQAIQDLHEFFSDEFVADSQG
ncbi:MAG: hypothetical protein ACRCXZ_09860 [Patescibacteria group bacterium]